MDEKELTLNDYVRMSIDSGVQPLELVLYPIVTVDGLEPIAYRSSTIIHSIILGDMKEIDYIKVSDNRLIGVELFKHNLQHAIGILREFDRAHKRCDFVSVRLPSQLVESSQFYDIAKGVLEANPSIDPSRLVVEFTENLMDIDAEKAKMTILDLKLLKLRTALVGAGKEDFKVSKLVSLPVDLVFIDKSASEWAGNRNKPELFNSLLAYIKAMGVDSIAVGNKEQKKEMHYSEAIGFMFEGIDPMSKEDALVKAEEA